MRSPASTPLLDQRFLVWLTLLTVGAFFLRQHFILVTEVEAPFRGDVRQYVAYAWNLLHHGTFSHVWPGEGTPSPDSFRSPGYPLFLAAWMAMAGSEGWYWPALASQSLLGALTVTGTVLLTRQWLATGWSLFAGGMVAVWPHHVAATGALLSEVLFGFVLIVALLLSAIACRRTSIGWAIAAGVAWAGASLVNPVALLFPVLAGVVLLREGRRHGAWLLLLLALAAPAAWGVRGLTLEQAPVGRGSLNLVQGSWPIYHEAHAERIRSGHPLAQQVIDEIDREARAISENPPKGLALMARRMSQEPGLYLRWYLLEKPWLLWDWSIRLGAGDVYWHRVSQSPLEEQPVLRSLKRGLAALNPALFAFGLLGALGGVLGWLGKRSWAPPPAALAGAFFLYVTAVHVVSQAEPRYAIPYRPVQMILVAALLAVGWRHVWTRLRTTGL